MCEMGPKKPENGPKKHQPSVHVYTNQGLPKFELSSKNPAYHPGQPEFTIFHKGRLAQILPNRLAHLGSNGPDAA
jgi:hypothetical protein